ncbi:entericidin A/B family lipoprotein [Halotalea alkalilenta]|nr:entericidin A/B family lipoprotein [Halotalea alkalilenta]
MKKYLALACLTLLGAGALAGCNTVDGAGQDIESGGEAIQNAAQ